MRVFLPAILLCAAWQSHAEQPSTLALGQGVVEQFYAGNTSAVWPRMTADMQKAIGRESNLKNVRDSVFAQLGTEERLLSERVESSGGFDVYLRRTSFSESAAPVTITVSFDRERRIAGFLIRPEPEAAESPYLDYDTQAQLRLPFDGEWYVFWGGRSVEQNYHAIASDQRFAYDFVMLRNGRSHTGDGTLNEQYHCWEQPILAPAAGIVTTAVDGLPDLNPGDMDGAMPAGNHVILNLGNDEFALFAHLRQDSIAVEKGDKVAAGEVLGLCGNSGNTSEPHLHFHIQDQDGFGKGLGKPAFFLDYLADGEPVERGEPLRGQRVEAAD
ncbi:MAG: peptidoglycan DD-metalloendopeptidase family protein [Pseudomonadota bacterium]